MNRDIERELFEAMKSIKVVDEESSELKAKLAGIYSMVSKDIEEQEVTRKAVEKYVARWEEKSIKNLKSYLRCIDKCVKLKEENKRLKNFIISLVQEYEIEEWLTEEHQEIWEMLNDKKEPDTDSESN